MHAVLLLAAALLALVSAPAVAQLRSVAVISDNDAYDFWIPVPTRPDRDYTNGIEVAAELDGAPLWGRLLRGRAACAEGCLTTELRAGQKIFTPLLDAAKRSPVDRPYAGWLYLAATGSVAGVRVRRTGGVEVGVTGPPSRAEWVQTTLHQLGGFRPPIGWDGQLKTEPGIVFRYGEEYAGDLRPAGIRVAEVVPYWGAALGNVRTAAHGGFRVRAGYGVPRRWGPAARRTAVSVYAHAGARAELVARDLFLDGNTFHDGPAVERAPAIGELEAGAALRLGPLDLAYRVVSRTRTYDSQARGHQYGSFQVTLQTSR